MDYIFVKPTPQTRIKDASGKPLPRHFRVPGSRQVLPPHGAHILLTTDIQRALNGGELERTTAEAVKAGDVKARDARVKKRLADKAASTTASPSGAASAETPAAKGSK